MDSQERIMRQLLVLRNMMYDEVTEVSAGKGYGGRRPRSITECFSKTVPALEAWLLKAEGILPAMRRELLDVRGILGFCYFARQEYAKATAVYEKIAENERAAFPIHSYHRIGALKRLVIAGLARTGRDGTL